MARINLRPWREERDAENQKRFITNVVIAAVVAGVVVFAISFFYDMQMDRQRARNQFVQNEIGKLDQKIKEIQTLKQQRERLLDRLGAIQDLQGNRPVIVRNFDELVRVLPDGVYYRSIVRRETLISIEGSAKSNNDVSELMRRIESSPWFGEPTLTRVAASTNNLRAFSLIVPLTKPKAGEGE